MKRFFVSDSLLVRIFLCWFCEQCCQLPGRYCYVFGSGAVEQQFFRSGSECVEQGFVFREHLVRSAMTLRLQFPHSSPETDDIVKAVSARGYFLVAEYSPKRISCAMTSESFESFLVLRMDSLERHRTGWIDDLHIIPFSRARNTGSASSALSPPCRSRAPEGYAQSRRARSRSLPSIVGEGKALCLLCRLWKPRSLRDVDPCIKHPCHLLLEGTVCPGSSLDGIAVRDAPLPKGCLLVSISRAAEEILPRGSTVLQAGDRVIALADGSRARRIQEKMLGLTGVCSPEPEQRLRE